MSVTLVLVNDEIPDKGKVARDSSGASRRPLSSDPRGSLVLDTLLRPEYGGLMRSELFLLLEMSTFKVAVVSPSGPELLAEDMEYWTLLILQPAELLRLNG